MTDILIVLAIVLSLTLIVLVTIQPRQNQLFSMDATSNIGKPSYWQSNTLVKVLYFIGEFGLIRFTVNIYGNNLQIKENFRYPPFVIVLKFSFLLSIFW